MSAICHIILLRGILCRCADNSSCGEALGRARDGRTRLPLSLQAPSLPIAASLKPAAKRRRTAVFTSLETYIEIKYTWTIRRHLPFSSVTFSISKFQSSLGLRRSVNLVTPEVCARMAASQLSSAHAFISSQLHTTRHPSFITPTATRRKSIAEARRTNSTFLSQSSQVSRHTITQVLRVANKRSTSRSPLTTPIRV